MRPPANSPFPSASGSSPAAASVVEIARQVSAGERSPVEVVQETLDAIGAADPAIRAFLSVDAEGALAQAAELASRITNTRRSHEPQSGPLAGVPVAVKDLEDAAGLRTTYGDPARAAAAPAVRDSLQVARLRAAGAIVVGKTTTPQYGWKGETDGPLFGATRNPRAPARTPGGSSGGSAAALAAGMVPLATGSDGGGSIRIPASCCGLAGFKPTTGVVPAGDDEAPAWGPLATRGPMARTFAEVAVALDVVSGPTHRDPAALPPLGSFTAAVAAPSVEGLRVAWSPTLGYATPTPAVLKVCEAAVERLEQLGAVVEPLDRVFPGAPLKAWLTLVSVGLRHEVLRQRTDQTVSRSGDAPGQAALDDAAGQLDAGLVAMVERAAAMTAERYAAAAGACHAVSLRLAAVWERFDLLACPVTADVAPRLDRPSVLGDNWAQCTYPFNLARSPAASVPAGVAEVDGDLVPVGLQLAAPRLHDLRLLRAAAALEATEVVTPR